jgi:hypothetical protein
VRREIQRLLATWTGHCLYCGAEAQLYESRIKKLADDYNGKGVSLVAIQPNNPAATRLGEWGYTDVSDSFNDMKICAAYRHFNFPYLYDGDTQAAANGYGPNQLPTPSSLIESGNCVMKAA